MNYLLKELIDNVVEIIAISFLFALVVSVAGGGYQLITSCGGYSILEMFVGGFCVGAVVGYFTITDFKIK